ncbi:MAG: peptidylprolyl isomerase [archaeon]
MKKFLVISLIVLVLLFAGCVQEEPLNNKLIEPVQPSDNSNLVENGDTVKVDYTGTLEEGTEFDSSLGRQPLEFTVGAGQMIAGFDSAVVGMTLNEEKNVSLPPEQAYGEINPELVMEFPIEELTGSGITPEIGLQVTAGNGAPGIIESIDTENNTVTVNFNPMLAGETLNFWIKVVEIKKG